MKNFEKRKVLAKKLLDLYNTYKSGVASYKKLKPSNDSTSINHYKHHLFKMKSTYLKDVNTSKIRFTMDTPVSEYDLKSTMDNVDEKLDKIDKDLKNICRKLNK